MPDSTVPHDRLLDHLRTEGEGLVADAAGALDRPVPHCPGWDGAQLLVHMGRVYRWAAEVARTGERQPGTRDPEVDDPAVWCRGGLDVVTATLGGLDPDRPCWNFGAARDRRVGWWTRRQAVETLVHRADALAAGGTLDPGTLATSDLAVAGIEEYLADFLPPMLRDGVEDLAGTLHLHCTDTDGEWLVDLDTPGPPRREHAKADTALRGPASSLLLWLWNRCDPAEGGIDVFGAPEVVAAWTRLEV